MKQYGCLIGAGEMERWVRASTAPAKDSSSAPSIDQAVHITIASNSSCRESNTFFWTPQTP